MAFHSEKYQLIMFKNYGRIVIKSASLHAVMPQSLEFRARIYPGSRSGTPLWFNLKTGVKVETLYTVL